MKLTKQFIKQVIKEELEEALGSSSLPTKDNNSLNVVEGDDGETYLVISRDIEDAKTVALNISDRDNVSAVKDGNLITNLLNKVYSQDRNSDLEQSADVDRLFRDR